jgi:hypothetical protein
MDGEVNILILVANIHNANYGYPQFDFWISTYGSVYSWYRQIEFWISVIHNMDIRSED